MVDLIDENGRLFGLVNIIDLLVVLIVVAMVGAGWALVSTSGSGVKEPESNVTQNTTTLVTFESNQVEPYVAEAVPNGSVGGSEVVAIRSKTVEPATVVVPDQNGQLHVREHPRQKDITLRLELDTKGSSSDLLFREKPLEVNRQLTLDLGTVSVTGRVTQIE